MFGYSYRLYKPSIIKKRRFILNLSRCDPRFNLIAKPLKLLDFFFEVSFIFLLFDDDSKREREYVNKKILKCKQKVVTVDNNYYVYVIFWRFSNLLITVCGIMNFLPNVLKCLHSFRHFL